MRQYFNKIIHQNSVFCRCSYGFAVMYVVDGWCIWKYKLLVIVFMGMYTKVVGLLNFLYDSKSHEIFQKMRSHTFFEVFKQQRQASFEKAKINVHLSWMEKDCQFQSHLEKFYTKKTRFTQRNGRSLVFSTQPNANMVVHVLCIHAQVRPGSPNVAKALMGSDDEYLKIIGNFYLLSIIYESFTNNSFWVKISL